MTEGSTELHEFDANSIGISDEQQLGCPCPLTDAGTSSLDHRATVGDEMINDRIELIHGHGKVCESTLKTGRRWRSRGLRKVVMKKFELEAILA